MGDEAACIGPELPLQSDERVLGTMESTEESSGWEGSF